MAHHHPSENLTPAERKFHEYMTAGEDFLKIELYRPARRWFMKALETGVDNKLAKEKIDFCNTSIIKEQRTIMIVASAVIIILLLLFII